MPGCRLNLCHSIEREPMHNLSELLEDQIKDLYSAESQLVKALPKMARAASTPELRQAVEQHLQETRTHVERFYVVAPPTLLGTMRGLYSAPLARLVNDEIGKNLVRLRPDEIRDQLPHRL